MNQRGKQDKRIILKKAKVQRYKVSASGDFYSLRKTLKYQSAKAISTRVLKILNIGHIGAYTALLNVYRLP